MRSPHSGRSSRVSSFALFSTSIGPQKRLSMFLPGTCVLFSWSQGPSLSLGLHFHPIWRAGIYLLMTLTLGSHGGSFPHCRAGAVRWGRGPLQRGGVWIRVLHALCSVEARKLLRVLSFRPASANLRSGRHEREAWEGSEYICGGTHAWPRRRVPLQHRTLEDAPASRGPGPGWDSHHNNY